MGWCGALPLLPMQVFMALLCIVAVLSSSLFWYYMGLAFAAHPVEITGVLSYSLTGLSLVAFGLAGVFFAWWRHPHGLFLYGALMAFMTIFIAVEMLTHTVTLVNCGKHSELRGVVCHVNLGMYYGHFGGVLGLMLMLCIVSMTLRKMVLERRKLLAVSGDEGLDLLEDDDDELVDDDDEQGSSAAVVVELIERAHETYDIVYGSFLSNHMTHGLIALYHMGASPERMRSFYAVHAEHDVLGNKLEPAREPTFVVDGQSWNEYTNRTFDAYPELYVFFADRLEELGRVECVQQFLPAMLPALASSALHPFIHTGLGLAFIESDIPLIQGLASFATSSIRVDDVFHDVAIPSGTCDLLDAVAALHDRPDLDDLYRRYGESRNFADKLVLLHEAIGPELAIDIVRWEATFPVSSYRADERESVRKMLLEVGRLALAAHWGTDCTDFFLLHGVTAFFALTKVVAGLQDPSHQREAIRFFAYSLLQLYAVVGAPTLKSLDHLKVAPCSWEDIKALILTEGSRKNDEHMIKLVYVCYELRSLFSDAEDLLLLKSTALKGASLDYYSSSDYVFSSGLVERNLL